MVSIRYQFFFDDFQEPEYRLMTGTFIGKRILPINVSVPEKGDGHMSVSFLMSQLSECGKS